MCHSLAVKKALQQQRADLEAEIRSEVDAVTLPVGTILGWQSTKITPLSYVVCNGQLLQISDYPALFNLLGTTYGSQPGMFGVPDFRGRTLIGQGQGSNLSPRNLGDVGGEEAHLLTVAEMPAHVHSAMTVAYTTPGRDDGSDSVAIPQPTTTGSTGGNAPHNNMQPFTVTVWLIKAQ